MSNSVRLIYILILVLIISGSAHAVDENSDQRGVLRDGLRFWYSGLPTTFVRSPLLWMDDDRVIWIVDLSGKPSGVAERLPKYHAGIVVWHLGRPTQLIRDPRWHEQTLPRLVCVGAGHIVYWIDSWKDPAGKLRALLAEGMPGQMTDKEMDRDDMKNSPLSGSNSYLHRVCAGSYYPGFGLDVIVNSVNGKYILDFGENYNPFLGDQLVSIKIYSPPNATLHSEIHIPRRDVWPWCSRYSETSNIFYLTNCGANGSAFDREENCLPYWTIDATALTALRHCVAPENLQEPSRIRLVPTARGLFFWTDEGWGSDTIEPEKPGLYEVHADRNVRRLSGVIDQAEVSPNGCRIAISYSHNFQDEKVKEGNHSVIAVDVCDTGDK